MDVFVGEIRIFAGNFAPRGWAFCNGQLLPVTQNTALFSLLGVTYGGDGRTNFGLPDLRGRAPMQQGAGPGLTVRDIGEKGGEANVTLTVDQIPYHSHVAKNAPSVNSDKSAGTVWASRVTPTAAYYYHETSDTTMHPEALAPTGNNLAHNNRQPYLGLNYIIALQGEFPQRP